MAVQDGLVRSQAHLALVDQTEPRQGPVQAQPRALDLPLQRGGPEFAVVGTIDPIDLLRGIVGQQFINAPEKVRIVFAPGRQAGQTQGRVAPEELVPAGFLDERDHPAADTSDLHLHMGGLQLNASQSFRPGRELGRGWRERAGRASTALFFTVHGGR